jgi:hypothetical protein
MKRKKSKERKLKGPVKVILLPEAKALYEKLKEHVKQQRKEGKDNTKEMQFLEAINIRLELIKKDPYLGKESKSKWSLKNYDVPNLYLVPLAEYWEIYYTIRNSQVEVICFMVD